MMKQKLNKNVFSTILCLLFTWGIAFAQTTISGKVSDEATKEPLPGAIILIEGTTNGAVSDLNGKFTLTTKSALPITLKVSNIGFTSKTITVTDDKALDILLDESPMLVAEVTVTGNRVEEKITKAPVTVEKILGKQLQQLGAFDQYTALQSLKGVDLLSQNMIFKSVNMRGFGANNNNRFVQLTDGMDNRSPGLGFGFGSAAGVSDLDMDNIEILPGASSALYGPDALQGLMLTTTKSPFDYTGLSAQVKTGINNVGKDYIGVKPYTDLAVRYAQQWNNKVAFKLNFQAINGTDFIADDYNDRSHRDRPLFKVNPATSNVDLIYSPNNSPSSNFAYDGVNIYGDDFTNGGAFNFTAANTTNAALVGKQVTRTGYTEYDLINNQGKIHSYRFNAAVHYKLTEKIEAIGAVYWGSGNLIRTAGFREYFPNYNRLQAKLELKGSNFFVRAYNTSQTAEGYSLGVLAQRTLTSWKSTAAWAADFATAYNGNIDAARAAADNGKPLPGSAAFNKVRDELIGTNNNVKTASYAFNGVRLMDNSSMTHTEGMYNFKEFLPEMVEVVTGASFRRYNLLTEGTIFPKTKDGSEFTINEYGWYMQASSNFKLADEITFKPSAAVRYDKNQYFKGGFTPRVSGVLSFGDHNFRASWQSAFRNPSPNQLLADGNIGEVGGSETAHQAANLYTNKAYTAASVTAYRASNNLSDLVAYVPNPAAFTTEKIKTWEVGYKSLIANKLYMDVFFYKSNYNDFIATQNYIQPTTGTQADVKNAATSKTYQVNFNNFNEIFVTGYGIGLDYAMGKGWAVSGNYVKQIGDITLKDNAGNIRKDAFGKEIVKRRMSDPVVAQVGRNFFISPEDRCNFTLSNPKLTKNIGLSLAYRWTGKMWVEQGNTQGDIWLPAWNTIDVAVAYKVPSIKTIVKVGASNVLNQYYSQGYGLAQIGGLYYISLNFDQFLN